MSSFPYSTLLGKFSEHLSAANEPLRKHARLDDLREDIARELNPELLSAGAADLKELKLDICDFSAEVFFDILRRRYKLESLEIIRKCKKFGFFAGILDYSAWK